MRKKSNSQKHLLIPEILEIKEIYSGYPDGITALILPDYNAGISNRYSVITINHKTGKISVEGREIQLSLAQKIAAEYRPIPKGRLIIPTRKKFY